MYHSFFTHSYDDGHLGCFHVLATVNSATMNTRVHMGLFQFWFPQGICQEVGLLGHLVVLLPVFLAIFVPSSIMAISNYIPTNSAKVFPFLHSLSSIYCLWNFLIKAILTGVRWYSSFDLHFSHNEPCWASFHVFISHLYVFFGELSV